MVDDVCPVCQMKEDVERKKRELDKIAVNTIKSFEDYAAHIIGLLEGTIAKTTELPICPNCNTSDHVARIHQELHCTLCGKKLPTE